MAPTFNNISLDQMKRLDLSLGIMPNSALVEKIEPNAYNLKRLVEEGDFSKNRLALMDWILNTMTPHGIYTVWGKVVNSSRQYNNLPKQFVQLMVPHIVRVTNPGPTKRTRSRFEGYKGTTWPKLSFAYAALHDFITDSTPIKKGSSFKLISWMDMEHGAIDATVETAQNEMKQVIFFPDEIKEAASINWMTKPSFEIKHPLSTTVEIPWKP
jgi:hypothetical protein